MTKTILASALVIGSSLGIIYGNAAHADVFKNDNLSVNADFRLRLENDWNSKKSSGSLRDNRLRSRIRARLGMTYKADDIFSLGMRLRSGSDSSHQSPHITILDFNNNDTGAANFNFDKYYIQAKSGEFKSWAGRNSLMFWKQNELLWDDDVTPLGVAGQYKTKMGDGVQFTLNGGYYSLPVGMKKFSGNLASGQAVLSGNLSKHKITVSAGLLDFNAEPTDDDASLLLRGNGSRDYTLLVGSFQTTFATSGQPIQVGFDYIKNIKDYNPADPDSVTAANVDQTDGYVASLRYGAVKKKGDWYVGYYYARMEALAVNASYAGDDWMRWGSSAETRASDYKGHEVRFVYRAHKRLDIVSRFYRVTSLSSEESGSRARIDLNFKF